MYKRILKTFTKRQRSETQISEQPAKRVNFEKGSEKIELHFTTFKKCAKKVKNFLSFSSDANSENQKTVQKNDISASIENFGRLTLADVPVSRYLSEGESSENENENVLYQNKREDESQNIYLSEDQESFEDENVLYQNESEDEGQNEIEYDDILESNDENETPLLKRGNFQSPIPKISFKPLNYKASPKFFNQIPLEPKQFDRLSRLGSTRISIRSNISFTKDMQPVEKSMIRIFRKISENFDTKKYRHSSNLNLVQIALFSKSHDEKEKPQRSIDFTNEKVAQFLNLFDDPYIKSFLDCDVCYLLSDRMLNAGCLILFLRSGLKPEFYRNFYFIILYILVDIWEESQHRLLLFRWIVKDPKAFFRDERLQPEMSNIFLSIDKSIEELLPRPRDFLKLIVDLRFYLIQYLFDYNVHCGMTLLNQASKFCCPDHEIWSRVRDSVHSGVAMGVDELMKEENMMEYDWIISGFSDEKPKKYTCSLPGCKTWEAYVKNNSDPTEEFWSFDNSEADNNNNNDETFSIDTSTLIESTLNETQISLSDDSLIKHLDDYKISIFDEAHSLRDLAYPCTHNHNKQKIKRKAHEISRPEKSKEKDTVDEVLRNRLQVVESDKKCKIEDQGKRKNHRRDSVVRPYRIMTRAQRKAAFADDYF